MESLAERAGYSRAHFSRIFKEHLGLSPQRYLEQIRLSHASRLLIESRGSIEETGRAVGFSDTSYFVQVFRKHKGLAPHQFRKTYR
jgi:transcriptional regulator GlxA family with amidase domain